MKKHLLIVDPIVIAGGSKSASQLAISHANLSRYEITVMTNDPDSWSKLEARYVPIRTLSFIRTAQHGVMFLMAHLLVTLNMFWVAIRYGKPQLVIGASSPNVDMSIYLFRKVVNFQWLQFVHGDVPQSRLSGKALLATDSLAMLKSSEASVKNVVKSVANDEQFHHLFARSQTFTFDNGLDENQWPSRSHQEKPVVYWAASLLKWKGLDTLIEAYRTSDLPKANICYIAPKDMPHGVTKAPVNLEHVAWHEKPNNLDELRANSSIFVSTSQREPFGLSILEAMAAGLAVIIPADGAYWDEKLHNELTCIKYTPNDSDDLSRAIKRLANDDVLRADIGKRAFHLAQHYRAQACYLLIAQVIDAVADGALTQRVFDEKRHAH